MNTKNKFIMNRFSEQCIYFISCCFQQTEILKLKNSYCKSIPITKNQRQKNYYFNKDFFIQIEPRFLSTSEGNIK